MEATDANAEKYIGNILRLTEYFPSLRDVERHTSLLHFDYCIEKRFIETMAKKLKSQY